MPAESERKDVRKAMAFDLLQIFKAEPDRTYTPEELERILVTYINGGD